MTTTATFTPVTGPLSLVGGPGPFADNGPLTWRHGAHAAKAGAATLFDGAFTVTASAGQVRVFRAFLDPPRAEHKPRRGVRAFG